MLPFLVPAIFTFLNTGCAKNFKENSGTKGLKCRPQFIPFHVTTERSGVQSYQSDECALREKQLSADFSGSF